MRKTLTRVYVYPLLTAISIRTSGRYMGNIGSSRVSVINSLIRTGVSLLLTYDALYHKIEIVIDRGDWVSVELLKIKWIFIFDSLSLIRASTVCIVSLRVQLYSVRYRREDPHLGRFRSLLNAFTFFRLLLVVSGNLVIFYAGWEGIGLCSYLLISFWYDRPQAAKAGLKAIIYNRIGDIAFLIAISLVYKCCGSLNFAIIDRAYPLIYLYVGTNCAVGLIPYLLLISIRAKSAQFGLHRWLPDAREGPTPVSALIHAATRVTAGIYLRLRANVIFAVNNEIRTLISLLGAFTALFGALTALFQFDIKRIIAFSTCSQLGYRTTAVGLNSFEGALRHLTRHAYFKALLFLVAGLIIHRRNNEQDIQKRGGLYLLYPFLYRSCLIGNRSLCARFSTSGFYSKDYIIELAYAKCTVHLGIIYLRLYFASIVTRLYSRRRTYIVFYRKTNRYKFNLLTANKHKLSLNSIIVLLSLSTLSLTTGYFLSEIRNPINLYFSDHTNVNGIANELHFIQSEEEDIEFISSKIKKSLMYNYGISLFIVYICLKQKRVMYKMYFTKQRNLIRLFFIEKRRLDAIINELGLLALYESRETFFLTFDKFIIELFTVMGANIIFIQRFKLSLWDTKSIVKPILLVIWISCVLRQLI